MITGYDEERGAVRSFMRKDIDRFRQSTCQKPAAAQSAVIRCLSGCVLPVLRAQAFPDAAVVGFQGKAAAIARQHQYGLTGAVNELARTQYPKRELLGLSQYERAGLLELIYQDLVNSR